MAEPPPIRKEPSRLSEHEPRTPEADPDEADDRPPVANANWAWRMGTEMVSATMIGAGIGYFLDRWLGTQPWLFLIFFIFGVAAGFLNLYRAVQMLEASSGTDSSNEGTRER